MHFLNLSVFFIRLILYSAFYEVSLSNVIDVPRIQTDIGQFEGRLLDFGDRGQVHVFYGLPFAQPPERFEKPEPPIGDLSEVRQALTPKLACPQLTTNPAFKRAIGEDCLYLNLFKPPTKSGELLPLVIFVHGGGYHAGTDLIHSKDYMAEHYVLNGIIYVTVHYRLGIVGLASSGEPDFGGNYALWDVRQALIWLRKNSANLGVDLERITLWGYSAGSSIVDHLTLSHQTRDLFAQAVQFSGNSINEWSYSNISVISTHLVGERLGCKPTQLKQCLKQANIEELQVVAQEIENHGSFINTNKFTPRSDSDFFEADLYNLLDSAPFKPTLISLTENEALLFVIYEIFNTSFYLSPPMRPEFTSHTFERMLRDKVVTEKNFGKKVDEVIEEIMEFYFPDTKESDYRHVITQYSRFISDILIVAPQLIEVERKVENGWLIFLVLNSHRDNIIRNYPEAESHETTHGFEYSYLFDWPFVGDTNLTAADLKFRDHLIGATVNFVKYGTPNGLDCCPFAESTLETPLVYTTLTTQLSKKNGLFERNVKFWKKLANDYDFNMIRGMKVDRTAHSEL